MYGLVQSYNLSVAVALSAWIVRQRLSEAGDGWWNDPERRAELLRRWGVPPTEEGGV